MIYLSWMYTGSCFLFPCPLLLKYHVVAKHSILSYLLKLLGALVFIEIFIVGLYSYFLIDILLPIDIPLPNKIQPVVRTAGMGWPGGFQVQRRARQQQCKSVRALLSSKYACWPERSSVGVATSQKFAWRNTVNNLCCPHWNGTLFQCLGQVKSI